MPFKPGNKLGHGRPKKVAGFDPKPAMRRLLPKAVREMEKILDGDDAVAKASIIRLVTERAWGKVPQAVEGVAGGPPVTINLRWLPPQP